MCEDIGLISVVIPIYNMSEYLDRAVKSMVKQTYRNFEIILVNDGSTDDSLNLAIQLEKEYDYIKVVDKKNGGLSSARNAGMEVARGAYIIFPDPDDWVSESYLEAFANLRLKYESDLEIGGYYIAYEKTQINPHLDKQEQLLPRELALEYVLSSKWFCGFAWNKLYHMDIIRKHKLLFDLELGMAQDLHFAFRYIACCEKVSFSPNPTYYYFQHIGGVTNARSPLTARKLSGLKTYEKLAELAGKNYPKAYCMAKSTLANMSIHFLFIYYYTEMEDREILTHIKKTIRDNFKYFMTNKEYSSIHKMQGVLARYFPKIYYFIRKIRINGGQNGV